MQELKGAGLLDTSLPPGFDTPLPKDVGALAPDEEPLDGTEQPPLDMHVPEEPQPE
jgi:segregation and condensation protein B